MGISRELEQEFARARANSQHLVNARCGNSQETADAIRKALNGEEGEIVAPSLEYLLDSQDSDSMRSVAAYCVQRNLDYDISAAMTRTLIVQGTVDQLRELAKHPKVEALTTYIPVMFLTDTTN